MKRLRQSIRLYRGRYTLESQIKKGGFGSVFLAREQGREEPVAIKVGHANGDPGYAKSIREEARILSELEHPNIVQVYPIKRKGAFATYHANAVELSGEPPYFVMEYLRGGTLDALVEEVGALPFPEAAAIALEIARGLYYMHELHMHELHDDDHKQGYTHNDLKLENIVFREPIRKGAPYVPVLVDFGVATRILPPDGISPYSTPPERIRQANLSTPPELEDEIDRKKVDVWGLGVILYCMLSGRLPFTGSEKRVTERILNEQPTSLVRLASGIPRGIDELIIDGCLAKDPRKRISLWDLGNELRQHGDGVVASRDSKSGKKPRFGSRFLGRRNG